MDRREFLQRLGLATAALVVQPLPLLAKLQPGHQMVPIDLIRVDYNKWTRLPYSAEREMFLSLVRAIAQSSLNPFLIEGPVPPVMLNEDAELIDGYYRVEAARTAGLIVIPAIVEPGMSRIGGGHYIIDGPVGPIRLDVTARRSDG